MLYTCFCPVWAICQVKNLDMFSGMLRVRLRLYQNYINIPKSNTENMSSILLDRIAHWTIARCKTFYLIDSCYSSCKNVQNTSCTKNIP